MENILFQLNDGNEESMGLVKIDAPLIVISDLWEAYYHDTEDFEVDELSVNEFVEQMQNKGYTIERVFYQIINI